MMNTNDIVADIREGIATGQHERGTRLPSVRKLAEEYGVSQQTVAAAYAVLAALGLVRTEGGSGTTVTAGRAADAHLGTYAPPDLAAALPWKPTEGGEASEETTLVRQVPADERMVAWGIESHTDVIERTRIRSVDGTPVQHKLTVLPLDIASRVPEGAESAPMLAPVGAPPVKPPHGVRVADWLGWDMAGMECAITVEPMDDAAAGALDMTPGSPSLRVEAVARSADGAVVYVTVTTAPLHHRLTLDIVG